MRYLLKISLHFFLMLVGVNVWGDSSLKVPQATVRLVAVDGVWHDADQVVAGVDFHLLPGWHTYWKNSGDSGAAPVFQYQIKGGTAGPVLWPAPERFEVGGIYNFGYQNRVVFPVRIKPQPVASDPAIEVALEFLVCKIECIPYKGTLDGKYSALTVASFPETYPLAQTNSPLTYKVTEQSASSVHFEVSSTKPLGAVDFFPLDSGVFLNEPPKVESRGNTYRALFKKDPNLDPKTRDLSMLAVSRSAEAPAAYEQSVSLGAGATTGFWRALGLAFLGGILLNLMPCVFPVLSIKILSFAGSGRDRKKLRISGVMYSLGVLVSFAVLGILLLVLRLGGEQLGWGFQLQYPPFVFLLGLLFFLIGLNFLGAFEVGYSLMNFGGQLMTTRGFQSAFGTGVLATVAATPCTAPFMGSALGLSLLLPPYQSVLIFLSLGFGMAFPFLLLCEIPGLVESLPRPGPWMERLKEFFAFPMFLTSVWLGWVLIQQGGPNGFVLFGASLVFVCFSQWILTRYGGKPLWKTVGLIFLIGSVLIPLWKFRNLEKATAATTSSSLWQPYEAKQIETAISQGRAVFIDFTASWCITCQINKKAVLETDAALKLFQQNNVYLVRADWTNADPEITKALAAYERNSVPLYVYRTPDGREKILPELLKMSDIENLFTQ